MKADHRQRKFLDHSAPCRIERLNGTRRQGLGYIQPKFSVIGRKPVKPGRVMFRIVLRHGMGEEIHIQRSVSSVLRGDQQVTQSVCIERRTGQRAEPARRADRNRHV